jgi:hypothetical protein
VHDETVNVLQKTFIGESGHKTVYYICNSQDDASRKYFYIPSKSVCS